MQPPDKNFSIDSHSYFLTYLGVVQLANKEVPKNQHKTRRPAPGITQEGTATLTRIQFDIKHSRFTVHVIVND